MAGRALAARGLRDPLWACGTLTRQRDTATLAMTAMGADTGPTVDPRWDEYDHIGLVRRHATAGGGGAVALGDPRAFQSLLDSALHRWVEADEEEGWRAFAGSASEALGDLATSLPPGRDAVVATSGGVIAAICAALLGGGSSAVVALNRVTVNTGLTTLAVGSSGTSLLTFNEHSHLSRAMRTYR